MLLLPGVDAYNHKSYPYYVIAIIITEQHRDPEGVVQWAPAVDGPSSAIAHSRQVMTYDPGTYSHKPDVRTAHRTDSTARDPRDGCRASGAPRDGCRASGGPTGAVGGGGQTALLTLSAGSPRARDLSVRWVAAITRVRDTDVFPLEACESMSVGRVSQSVWRGNVQMAGPMSIIYLFPLAIVVQVSKYIPITKVEMRKCQTNRPKKKNMNAFVCTSWAFPSTPHLL